MQYYNNYLNQIFLGKLCNIPIINPNGDNTNGNGTPNYDPFVIVDQAFVGKAVSNLNKFCSIYQSGNSTQDISGQFFNQNTGKFYNGYKSGFQISEYFGKYTGYNANLSETSGFFFGLIQISGFSGYLETNFTGKANFNINGDVYGFGLNNIIDVVNQDVDFNGHTWSAFSGSISSGFISGSGYYNMSCKGIYSFDGHFSSTGTVNEKFISSGYGTDFFDGLITGASFSGNSLFNNSGSVTGLFSGYRTGYCKTEYINTDVGCHPFKQLIESCNTIGNLDVRVTYPNNNQVFSLPYVVGQYNSTDSQSKSNQSAPFSQNIAPVKIWFEGGVWETGNNHPASSGDINDHNPEYDPNLQCPSSYIITYPSCQNANGGAVGFSTQNTDYNKCKIQPPYSGIVTKTNFADPEDISNIYIFNGNEGMSFPNSITFNNLETGIYKLTLSGATGSKQYTEYLTTTGQTQVQYSVIGKTTNCLSNDGIARFTWDAPISYKVEGTAYAGQSTTGFIAYNLNSEPYIATFIENARCNTIIPFRIDSADTFKITQSKQGVSCTGNGHNGELSISVGGTQTPYSILWSSEEIFTNPTNFHITGLATGLYNYVVTDSFGCTVDGHLFLGIDNNNLSCYISVSGNSAICCQAGFGEPVPKPRLEILSFGGKQPHTYEWHKNGLISNDKIITGELGEYTAYVTDANGCVTSSKATFEALKGCVKFYWVSVDQLGNKQEYTTYNDNIDTNSYVPFTYTLPGDYIVSLSASDSYGRTGISCINFSIKGYYDYIPDHSNPDVPPDEVEGERPTDPDESVQDIVVIPVVDDPTLPDFQDLPIVPAYPSTVTKPENPVNPIIIIPPDAPFTDPPTPGGGSHVPGDKPKRDNSVCCILLSNGINDTKCKTTCVQDASFCKGKSSDNYTKMDCIATTKSDCCKSCDQKWTVKKGACCVCKFIENVEHPDLGYEDCQCAEVSSCDPNAACNRLVQEMGGPNAGYYTHGFKEGKNCNEGSTDYACTMGICCQKPNPDGGIGGNTGRGCGSLCLGRMTTSNCGKIKGKIISEDKLTCADAGAILFESAYYCDLNPVLCCIKPKNQSSLCLCGQDCCVTTSTCVECEQKYLNIQAASPQCDWEKTVTPYLINDKNKPKCTPKSCGCPANSTSAGVGGPT